MMQQPRGPATVLEGHLQGLARQGRGHPLVHRPPHDPSRVQIHEDRHVQPALAGGHVRDITRPFLVRGARRKDTLQLIGGHKFRRHDPGGAPPASPTAAADAMEAHQPGHAMAADPDPVGPQVLMNPRTAIPTVRCPIAGPDMGEEPRILALPPRLAAPTPGIKPTAGDLQHPTQDLHRIRDLLRFDEAIPQDDSLAKKAIAFFKMSRSCRTWSSSRRTALSSSVARKPLVPSGILAACKFHRLRVVWPMPSSRATCVAVFPLRRSSSTASCLNSGVNFRRAFPMRHLRVASMPGRCPQNQGKTTRGRRPELWFLVGLGCLRLESRQFLNRGSHVQFLSLPRLQPSSPCPPLQTCRKGYYWASAAQHTPHPLYQFCCVSSVGFLEWPPCV